MIRDSTRSTTFSGLPPGSRIGFQICGDLEYWDGAGAVVFDIVPADETIALAFGPDERVAGTGPQTDTAIMLFGPPVDADGGFHAHLVTSLRGADGNTDPASVDGVEAAPGVYVVKVKVASDVLDPSEAIFLVFNNGLADTSFDAAIAAVEARITSPQVPILTPWGQPILIVLAIVFGCVVIHRRNQGVPA
jgi:hypothetical protein